MIISSIFSYYYTTTMSNWCKGQTWCERVMSLFIIGGQYAWWVVPWCMIVCLWPAQCQHWKNSSIWHSPSAPVKGLPRAQLLKWKERHSGVLSRLVVQLQFNKLVARELLSENQNSPEEASLFTGSYVCMYLATDNSRHQLSNQEEEAGRFMINWETLRLLPRWKILSGHCQSSWSNYLFSLLLCI
jgi:hypothetical protein